MFGPIDAIMPQASFSRPTFFMPTTSFTFILPFSIVFALIYCFTYRINGFGWLIGGSLVLPRSRMRFHLDPSEAIRGSCFPCSSSTLILTREGLAKE